MYRPKAPRVYFLVVKRCWTHGYLLHNKSNCLILQVANFREELSPSKIIFKNERRFIGVNNFLISPNIYYIYIYIYDTHCAYYHLIWNLVVLTGFHNFTNNVRIDIFNLNFWFAGFTYITCAWAQTCRLHISTICETAPGFLVLTKGYSKIIYVIKRILLSVLSKYAHIKPIHSELFQGIA